MNGCLVHDGATSRRSDDGYVGTPQAALIRRKSSTIGVGRTDYIHLRLLPNRTVPNRTVPNRTGGSPAYAKNVENVGRLPPVPLLRSLRRSSALRLLWATIRVQVHINLVVLKVWFAVSPVPVSSARINEVAIGHDVLGSSSEVLNVAIIAPA